ALAAVRAQPRTVVDAQRGQGEREHHGVTHGLLDVDVVVDDAGQLVVVRRLVGGAVRVGEQLPDLHGQLVGQVAQTARALAGQRRRGGPGDVDALADRLQ